MGLVQRRHDKRYQAKPCPLKKPQRCERCLGGGEEGRGRGGGMRVFYFRMEDARRSVEEGRES